MTRFKRSYLIGLVLAAAPTVLLAQSPETAQERSDIYAARAAAIGSTLTGNQMSDLDTVYQQRGCGSGYVAKSVPSFDIPAGGQISYNSNPDPGSSAGADGHVHPDFDPSFEWQGRVRFDADLDINSDRYFSVSEANLDEAALSTKLAFTDGRNCTTTNTFFYVSNKYVADFSPFFASASSKVDAITVGISGALPLRRTEGHWRRASFGDAAVVIKFDLSAGRQEANPSKLNSTIVLGKAALSVPLSDALAIGLGPTLKETWRDSTHAHSLLFAGNLVVKYFAFDRQLEVDFVEAFSDVHGSGSSSSFTQNDIGPSIIWTWHLL